jgi:hypothetical protein
MLGQLPTILALHRAQQALQIGPYPPARLDPAKTRRDLLDQRVQPAPPIDSFIHRGHSHALHGRSEYHNNPGCSIRTPNRTGNGGMKGLFWPAWPSPSYLTNCGC